LREAIGHVANATFAIRRPEIWGEGTTSWGLFSNRTKNNAYPIAEMSLYFMEPGEQATVYSKA